MVISNNGIPVSWSSRAKLYEFLRVTKYLKYKLILEYVPVNVKLSLCFITQEAMMAHGGGGCRGIAPHILKISTGER